ncbi:MAG: hypothetical protein ACT4O9_08280 [Blastocatellia bacterium]
MNHFTNPLDSVRIASPCSSDWNLMFGNQRKRFCSECSLNVYNLSDMTREEAENFLLRSEGRVCVKMFRRNDGSVITRNCPVGFKAAKEKLQRVASALCAIVVGFVCGIFGFQVSQSFGQPAVSPPVSPPPASEGKFSFFGMMVNLEETKDAIMSHQQIEKV